MEQNSPDIHLLLGRIDGRTEAISNHIAQHTERLNDIDTRQGKIEQRVSVVESRHSTAKTWITVLISAAAFGVALLTFFNEHLR